MSSRARRIPAATPADEFAWGDHAGPETADPLTIWQAAEMVWGSATDMRPDDRQAAPVPPPAPAEPAPPTAEQLAHLAALERDAFTKGYAQGERAGIEAGGQRAEAMLRRLAATLEELSTLRDQMMRQAEGQLLDLSLAIARRILHREVSIDPDLAAALAHVALDRAQHERLQRAGDDQADPRPHAGQLVEEGAAGGARHVEVADHDVAGGIAVQQRAGRTPVARGLDVGGADDAQLAHDGATNEFVVVDHECLHRHRAPWMRNDPYHDVPAL